MFIFYSSDDVTTQNKMESKCNNKCWALSGQPPRSILPKVQVKRLLSLSPPGPGPYWTPQFLTSVGQTVTMVPFVFQVPGHQGAISQSSVPATTVQAGATPKRPYRRTVQGNTCKKCGQFCTGDTGHSQSTVLLRSLLSKKKHGVVLARLSWSRIFLKRSFRMKVHKIAGANPYSGRNFFINAG